MKKGDIYWANLPKPVGNRPVLLLTRDKAITVRESVTIAQITTTIRDIPVEVSLGKEEGLPKNCVVNLDVINTIPKDLITDYIGSLCSKKMGEVEKALKFALGLS